MDIRRTVIFIGLAISTYFLILAWNDDYGQNAQVNAPIAAVSDAQDAPVPVEAVPAANADAGADVPQVDAPEVAPEQIDVAKADGQLVQVKTDVLQVTIDPRGGEVVQVLLPAYPASIEQKDVPFVLMEENSRRTYVAQSGLLGKDGVDAKGPALYSVAETNYELGADATELTVVLSTATDKGTVEKIFTFRRGDYLIDVTYRINNTSDQNWQGVFYAQLKRDNSADPSAGNSMGMQSYLGAALTTKENRYEKIGFDDLTEAPYKSVQQGGWAAMLQHYFLAAWIPAQDQPHTYNGRSVKGNNVFGFYDAPTTVAPGSIGEVGASLYVGPKDQKHLAEIAEYLDLTIDYGWLWWVAKPLFSVLNFIQSGEISVFGWFDIDLGGGVGNWGVAIIILTILIKLAFFKLSAASYRSMANMRKVAPKMQEIKEKYGDNREKLGQEMMALYKKEKINPLGGCLPILVQMPVFIALYWVLMESVELRQAPFFLWIEDMSVMDPYFILPLIMGASMFIQMKLNPTPPDPMQARVMQFMPIIFTIFFLWFPAGLVLYWVVNNILSIAQQYVITKQIENS
ncbi:membrane protein insertase YidC [Bacterioplanoides sp.]|uniref:membrane protein insertase YidC n=1 Tax=Bacterioplanoides sp. TaxID=2066072 RepID=UPI003B5BD7D8